LKILITIKAAPRMMTRTMAIEPSNVFPQTSRLQSIGCAWHK
jgi:hypothetical protein